MNDTRMPLTMAISIDGLDQVTAWTRGNSFHIGYFFLSFITLH
jgi:hypothetical protein